VIPQTDSHAGPQKDHSFGPLVSMSYVFILLEWRKLSVFSLVLGGIFRHVKPQSILFLWLVLFFPVFLGMAAKEKRNIN